jgi:hypothetical protein
MREPFSEFDFASKRHLNTRMANWGAAYVAAVRELIQPEGDAAPAVWQRSLATRPSDHRGAGIASLAVAGAVGIALPLSVVWRGGHDVLVGLFQIDHMTSRAVMLGATLAMMLAILVGTGLFILAFRAMSWATFYVWPGDRHQ